MTLHPLHKPTRHIAPEDVQIAKEYRDAIVHRFHCEKAERLAKIDADHARDIERLYADRLGWHLDRERRAA